jgi:hypothetical protein
MFSPNILLRLSRTLLTKSAIVIGIQFELSFVVLEHKNYQSSHKRSPSHEHVTPFTEAQSSFPC